MDRRREGHRGSFSEGMTPLAQKPAGGHGTARASLCGGCWPRSILVQQSTLVLSPGDGLWEGGTYPGYCSPSGATLTCNYSHVLFP